MTDNQIEKIEAFLSGKMEDEEQKNFERELETDTALAAAFNTYVAIETDMFNKKEYAIENNLKTTLTKLNTHFFDVPLTATNPIISNSEQPAAFETTPSKQIPSKIAYLKAFEKWKLAAAVFLGILAIASLYVVVRKKNTTEEVAIVTKKATDSFPSNKNGSWKPGADQSPILILPNLVLKDTSNSKKNIEITNKQQQQLFAKYFIPDGTPTDMDGPLEDAFIQYENKQYTDAAVAFEDADLTTRGEETDVQLTKFYANYYKALSNMAGGKYNIAIQQLKKSCTSNTLFTFKVQWYLALAYLKIGNIKDAIHLLQAVHENNKAGAYKLKANELLMRLKSNN